MDPATQLSAYVRVQTLHLSIVAASMLAFSLLNLGFGLFFGFGCFLVTSIFMGLWIARMYLWCLPSTETILLFALTTFIDLILLTIWFVHIVLTAVLTHTSIAVMSVDLVFLFCITPFLCCCLGFEDEPNVLWVRV